MTKSEMAALLGRPLTSIEDTNFNLYLDIAYDALEDLICTPVNPATESRTFGLREGYRTAFVDIFNAVTEVKVDGTVIDPSKYASRQWDKRNASWYNSLVFDDRFTRRDEEIEVTATWGFPETSGDESELPSDLQLLLAGMFDLITKKNKIDPSIASKQVEDFRISFNNVDLDTEFRSKYADTIAKYSLCDIPNVQHGKVHSTWKIY